MPGLDPGFHANRTGLSERVDGRVKPGHDGMVFGPNQVRFA
jgi:hypothetical protein